MGHTSRHEPELIEEVIYLCQTRGLRVSEVAAMKGMEPVVITTITQNHGAPSEPRRYRLPHFDRWCFVYDNIEVDKLDREVVA